MSGCWFETMTDAENKVLGLGPRSNGQQRDKSVTTCCPATTTQPSIHACVRMISRNFLFFKHFQTNAAGEGTDGCQHILRCVRRKCSKKWRVLRWDIFHSSSSSSDISSSTVRLPAPPAADVIVRVLFTGTKPLLFCYCSYYYCWAIFLYYIRLLANHV